MKAYILIPLHKIRNVSIKEQNRGAARVALTPDYSECFGNENEYYIDWESRVEKAGGFRTAKYKYDYCKSWYYTALNPQDIIKKKIIKVEEAKV